jgi:hypothetical protein
VLDVITSRGMSLADVAQCIASKQISNLHQVRETHFFQRGS